MLELFISCYVVLFIGMKRKFIYAIALMIALTSCNKKGCTDPQATNYNEHAQADDGTCNYESQYENLITGAITENTTLTSDKIWTLQGRVSVTSGTTLTIEPGTIIKAVAGTGANASCLIIARGATINAQGTAQQPIVFTSVIDDIVPGNVNNSSVGSLVNGLWGGVIILGNATISAPGNIESMQIEGIPASDINGLYGGNDDDDNSGVLSYVSIRHGGANIGAGNEINGLTLGGVGSGTTIDNIEIIANQDDGIELFGGTVNVSNLVVWGAADDCVDIDQAYNGDIDHVVIIPSTSTDHVMEIDGGEGATNAPFTLTNVSVIGADAQAHIRAEAIGVISLYGDVNVEMDPDTNVILDSLLSAPNQDYSWTYTFNNN